MTDTPRTADAAAEAAWDDALTVAACIVVDPVGLGGVRVRAAAGPVRDAWTAAWRALLPPDTPVRPVPLSIDDARLFGGLDLAASLRAGRPIRMPGVIEQADGGFVVLAMAERIDAATAARVASALDARDASAGLAAIALDEGDGDERGDEALPGALTERLALTVDLRRVSVRTVAAVVPSIACGRDAVAGARARLADVVADDAVVAALCATAATLGIDSMRMPVYAIRVARAIAALDGRDVVDADDAAVAARLVYASRVRRVPAAPPPDTAEADVPPDDAPPDDADLEQRDAEPPDDAGDAKSDDAESDDAPSPPDDPTGDRPLDEVVLDATVAAIPAGLLARLAAGAGGPRAAGAKSGAGARGRGGRRGAPAGVRRGRPRSPERLSLVETLRAAAPWQAVRRAESSDAARRVHVRAEDLHVVRFKQRHPTTTVFVVDASGSAALHRLGEAKGAVELLLADCYVRRDSVAVLAFRGRGTELLLPPTRSLARARRSLAGLPGGGGTPLASALDATREMIDGLRRRGDTVLAVLLTDGRANVARDGSGGRPQAEADALASARALRAIDADVLLIDTSPQPYPQAARLADAMGATYRALPHAGAAAMSGVVNQVARSRSDTGRR